MSMRAWIALALLVAALGWWFSPHSPRGAGAPEPVAGERIACPMPPLVARGEPPRQSPLPRALSPFRLQPATLVPLAGFSVHARVLSREDYRFDREAELAPTDLALGWGRMGEDAVLDRLEIDQSGRWFHYRYEGEPPIPPDEIVASAANMHLIPADDTVARALRRVRAGDRVRIDGWLVEAQADDGWRWRSSLSRNDSGSGACELIYVCAITVE